LRAGCLTRGTDENLINAESSADDRQDVGTEQKRRLHLYHIYYGAVRDPSDENKITHVVESVADVTETVLEYPFLLRDQHDLNRLSAEGVPPIGIVEAERPHRVLEMNHAKWLRCKKTGEEVPKPKEDLLGLSCAAAFGRKDTDCGDPCPVTAVVEDKEHKSHKAMTYYPNPAMVTAVPLFGPKGEVRAVFEFIDDLSELMQVENAVHDLNAACTEMDVVRAILNAFMSVADGDRAIYIEFHNDGQVLLAKADDASEYWDNISANVSGNNLASTVRNIRTVLPLDSLLQHPDVPDEFKKWSSKIRVKRGLPVVGRVLLVPLSWEKDSPNFALVAVERGVGQREFTQEQILYARVLSDHAAAAIRRAKEHMWRECFIKAMTNTAGILTPEAALQRLVTETIELFPEDIDLLSFRFIKMPGQDDIKMVFAGGAGNRYQEESSIFPNKWLMGKEVKPTPIVAAWVIRDGKPLSRRVNVSAKNSDRILVLERTRWVRILPLTHQNQVWGCLVAESPHEDTKHAFPFEVEILLDFLARFCGVLVSRFELLRQCMSHLHGHVLKA
ncbi:MAG: PAS domain-containing protein, partial [Candidatus Hydrogenedentales bacterium]